MFEAAGVAYLAEILYTPSIRRAPCDDGVNPIAIATHSTGMKKILSRSTMSALTGIDGVITTVHTIDATLEYLHA